jgi:cytoskeletal protein CcmA (bactofilin family)
MSLKPFNVKSGLSVGSNVIINVIDENGNANFASANFSGNVNVTGNFNGNISFAGNVSANTIEAVTNANLDLLATGTGNININAGNGNVVISSNITSTGNLATGNLFVNGVFSSNSISANYITIPKQLTLSNANIVGPLIPSSNNTSNIGNANNIWNTAHVAEVRTSLANVANIQVNDGVSSNLIPSSNVTYVLGNSTRQWENISALNGTFSNSVISDRFSLLSNGFTTSIYGNANITANWAMTLPAADGSNNQVLATDGNGNLKWYSVLAGIANGTSNMAIPTANGNVTISAAGNANIITVTGTGANVTGTANVSGNLSAGNLGTTGVLSLTSGDSFTTASLGAGNIILNSGTADTPGVHFYQDNNNNYGIDVENGTLRFTKNLDETGGTVIGRINADGNIIANGQLQGASGNVTGNMAVGGRVLGAGNYVQPSFIQPNNSDANWSFGVDGDGSSNFWMQAQFYGQNQQYRGFRVLEREGNTVVFSVNGNGNATVSGSANITGNVDSTGSVNANGGLTSNGDVTFNHTTGSQRTIQITDGQANAFIVGVGNAGATWGGAGSLNFITSSSPAAPIVFYPAQSEVFRITTTGANVTGTANISGNTTVGNLVVTGNVQSNLLPNANITYDLGSSTQRWKDIWLANSTIYLGSQNISSNSTAITFSGNLSAGNVNFTELSTNNIVGNGNVTTKTVANSYVAQVSGGTGGFAELYWTSNIDNADPYLGNDDYVWSYVSPNGAFMEANLSNVVYQWNFFGGNGNVRFTSDANSITFDPKTSNITALNFIGALADGNSNVLITTNANVNISAAGNANILTVSGTGARITGNLNTTGNIQVSGKKAVNGPAFSAYANSTGQTITSGSQQKVLFQTEEFDTDNCFASSRFTPTVEGYYQLNAMVRLDGSFGTGETMIVLWKNGAEYKRGWNASGVNWASSFGAMTVSALVYANGSTDYFEIYVQQTSGGSMTVTAVNNTAITWFNGCMVRGA